MLRGALVTALVASSLACGGDAIGADDRARAGGSRPNVDAVVVDAPALKKRPPRRLGGILRGIVQRGVAPAAG